MLIWFPSNQCILSLVLNVWNHEKNTEVWMAICLSSNGRISGHFDNNQVNCQNMPILRCGFTPYCQNIKILKIDFCDVITMNSITIRKGQLLLFLHYIN